MNRDSYNEIQREMEKAIVDMKTGDSHTVYTDELGELYAFGNNKFGQIVI